MIQTLPVCSRHSPSQPSLPPDEDVQASRRPEHKRHRTRRAFQGQSIAHTWLSCEGSDRPGGVQATL
ncbi:MAG: hypothetical protein DWC10_01280 [Candidatus Poseidoniales archaeon]|nr:MAG: hypothetical protein DWC10_01280 [Candidatus Poseidoniales archaeon]